MEGEKGEGEVKERGILKIVVGKKGKEKGEEGNGYKKGEVAGVWVPKEGFDRALFCPKSSKKESKNPKVAPVEVDCFLKEGRERKGKWG